MVVWLEENHPTPYPVIVKWVPIVRADDDEPALIKRGGYFGETYWCVDRKKIVIELSRKRCRELVHMAETLLHEWAHAMTMPNDRLYRKNKRHMPHGPAWGLAYSEVYTNWHDEDGASESREIEV